MSYWGADTSPHLWLNAIKSSHHSNIQCKAFTEEETLLPLMSEECPWCQKKCQKKSLDPFHHESKRISGAPSLMFMWDLSAWVHRKNPEVSDRFIHFSSRPGSRRECEKHAHAFCTSSRKNANMLFSCLHGPGELWMMRWSNYLRTLQVSYSHGQTPFCDIRLDPDPSLTNALHVQTPAYLMFDL